MLKYKKIIILLTVIIVIIVIAFCIIYISINKNDARGMIKDSLGIELPNKCQITNYKYFIERGIEHYDAKILLDNQDIENVKFQLSNVLNEMDKPYICINSYKYTWWKLRDSKIEIGYELLTSYEKKLFFISYPKTHGIYAYIVIEEGQYYLYIAY